VKISLFCLTKLTNELETAFANCALGLHTVWASQIDKLAFNVITTTSATSLNKQPMDAQLAYSHPLLDVFEILTSKEGQTDLVFGMQSGFINRSVHARLQVSVCSGYDLFHLG